MTGHDHRYCALYLNGLGRRSAAELVAAATGGVTGGFGVRVGEVVFDVRPNPDVDLAADFIGWPLKIDVESPAEDPAIVDAVARVLLAAWSLGHQALAACGFEDELPERGGYPRYRA